MTTEKMIGLKRAELIGKKGTEILPLNNNGGTDLIDLYDRVARDGETFNFEQFNKHLERMYDVRVYSDEPGYFVTLFNEITPKKQETASMQELLKLTEKLLSTNLSAFNYQEAVETLQPLSGAKFAAINMLSCCRVQEK